MDESPISLDLTNACLLETALNGVKAKVVGRPGAPPGLGEGWARLLLPVPPGVAQSEITARVPGGGGCGWSLGVYLHI